MKIALVTNALEYAGPPAAAALAKIGWTVFCADDAFNSSTMRDEYERNHPAQVASTVQDPAGFVAEGLARFGRIDALISNDIPQGTRFLQNKRDPSSPGPSSDLLEEFEAHINSLLLEPVRLLRAALPAMKTAKSGSIVLVTSGGPLVIPPVLGAPHGYVAARGAANTLAKLLSVELAAYDIQVNAVAPYLVYSQTFFPSAIGANDPKFVPLVNQIIPMKRFGDPEEIGLLIANLASGQMSFVSGQVIAFSGAGC